MKKKGLILLSLGTDGVFMGETLGALKRVETARKERLSHCEGQVGCPWTRLVCGDLLCKKDKFIWNGDLKVPGVG